MQEINAALQHKLIQGHQSLISLAFPSEPKLNMLVSSNPKRIELIAESCAGHPVICRPADISIWLVKGAKSLPNFIVHTTQNR